MNYSGVRSLVFFVLYFVVLRAFPIGDEGEAVLYLQKFGYLEETSSTGAILGQNAISGALKDFQRFAGINQTGTLDNDTIVMMNTPRCGVKDKMGHSDSARRKRYALQGSKWQINHLTYKISKYPSKMRDKLKIDKEIAKAFKIWSDVIPLTFEERKQGRASIDISFETSEHGDSYPFDGPQKTLAHAFFPQFGGDVHFNDAEMWTIDERRGTNMLQVAVHEFGHSLGLSHTNEKKALMAPYYKGYIPNLMLDVDDVKGIQALYGTRYIQPPPVDDEPVGPPPDTSDAPDLCQDGTIDAVTRTQNGNSYVFKGDFYWKVLNYAIADGYPRKITDDWGGLEGNLDASLTLSDGKTYFFKGTQYWRFTNKDMDPGYPKAIARDFEGIPDSLDAAVVWSGNGKTYFFKGDQYWRYDNNSDPPVSNEFPKPISNWNGLPNDIDAAFQWDNSRTYFFKGDIYYRYNDISFEVDSETPRYPRSTSVWWFGCQTISRTSSATASTETYSGTTDNRPPPVDDEPPGPTPDLSDAPNLCQDATIDAVTRTQNGNSYVFKGDFYWKVLNYVLADGYPRKIADDWDGLEGNLDASLTLSNGKTYFFKGTQYWSFTNKDMDPGYPKALARGFEGIPDTLDAAFVWSGNGNTYFFKGDKYWRYDSNSDPPVSNEYPLPISSWNGLPNDIDAAFQWENNKTYFFKSDKYYRYNDTSLEVDLETPPYPRSTSVWWFGC